MGLLALQRLMSLQRNRQRRNRPLNGSIASVDEGRGSPCQLDACGDSQAAKRMMCSIPALPEDILHYIHSLLPLRDAARAACSSRAFLRSWRCHPILTLSRRILASNANAHQQDFSFIIDNILRKHSGIGIRLFKLELYGISDACNYLDSWLQIAVRPGIQVLNLKLCRRDNMKYNVPCTLLSDGVRSSIQCLQLSSCAFHPTAELGPLRKLTIRPLGLPGDKVPQDTLCAAAAPLPKGFLLLKAASDREQSSKSLEFYHRRREGQSLTWRNNENEEPAHVPFKPHLLCPR